MTLTLITSGLIVAIGAAVWLLRLRDALRSSRADAIDPEGAARTSVIVPARNEAHNLPALMASLRSLEPGPLEIIVVDDHSTDDTAAIARASGARVVTPPPLPAGWLGKPWACRAGAEVARGDYLLFTDADTVHGPQSLGRAVARARTAGAGMVSVVPTHIVAAAWERLQGVFHLLLLIATRAGGSAHRSGERRFSIGQYLLFTRAAYERIDGHEHVRFRVAEDLALARLVRCADLGFETLHAPGLLNVRMYPEGFRAFVRGWRRNFREGLASAGIIGVLEIAAVIGWLLGVPLYAAQAFAAGDVATGTAWAAVYAVTAVEIARRQRHIGAFGPAGAVLYPAFVVVFAVVSVLAVFDKMRRAPIHWKQRVVASSGAPPEESSAT